MKKLIKKFFSSDNLMILGFFLSPDLVKYYDLVINNNENFNDIVEKKAA